MAIYFVTRHPGAVEWACEQGFGAVEVIPHLDAARVAPCDTVLGTLPVHLAAAVCERGARYFNLSLDMPAEFRGRELTADELRFCSARLERYEVWRVPDSPPWPPA